MKIYKEEKGQVLIEFALFVSIFVLILAGISDYAFYIHDAIELNEAAAVAAAYGTTPGFQKSANWSTSIFYMQSIAVAAAPDVSGVSAVASYFYTCTPGGVHVVSNTVCTRSNYTTPIMYVTVQTNATVPAVLRWRGISSSLTLQGNSTYRVPWAQ